MATPIITAMYITTAISVATSVYTILAMPSQEDVGAKTQKRGTNAPRKVPYGNCIIDTVNVYNNVLNSDSGWLTKVFSLGVGPIQEIEQVYVDDSKLLNYNNTTNPNTSPSFIFDQALGHFVPAFNTQGIKMQFRYGQLSETTSSLAIQYGDGEWTINHRGDRVPHITLTVDRSLDSDTPIMSSAYTLLAAVKGVLVHDPRFHAAGVKEYKHSDPTVPIDNQICGRNPSICLLDFLVDPYYGMDIPYSYINEQSFIDAANWTDLNKIFIDGNVDTGEKFGDCLSQMMSTFQGMLIIENGLITCKYEDKVSVPYPTVFDEDNTISISNIKNASDSSYYNIVETNYKNVFMSEKGDVYQIPKDINYIPAGATKSRIQIDGFKKTKKLEMPMTIDNYYNTVTGAVKLFSNRLYIKSLYQRGVSIAIDLKQHPVKIFDVIKISNASLAWNQKLFRVTSITKSVNHDSFNVGDLLCEEYSDEAYLGTLDGLTGRGRTRVNTDLSAATNLSFTLENFLSDGYGKLTWLNPNRPVNITYIIEYKLSSEAIWKKYGEVVGINEAKIIGLKLGTYDFRVKATLLRWYDSPYTELLGQVITSTVNLPTVTSLVVEGQGINFNFAWDDMSEVIINNPPDPIDPDSKGTTGKVADYFSFYEIKIYHNSVYKKTYQSKSPKFSYLFEENVGNVLDRVIRADVAIVAKDGAKSSVLASVTGTNTQVSIPANVSVNVLLGLANITWSPRTELDFSGTEIHISTTAGFTPGATTLVDTLQAESVYQFTFPTNDIADRYVRIGHFDKFSTTGISYSLASLIHTTNGFPVNDAQVLSISSSSQTFTYNSSGVLISPSPITFTANRQNITNTVVWSTLPNVASGTSDNFSVTAAQFAANQSIKVTATAGAYIDEITVVRLQDGNNGYDALTVILSNESHTIPTDTSGNFGNYSGSATTVRLYEGTTELNFDGLGTSNSSWKITLGSTNITAGALVDQGLYALIQNASNMTADTASIDITITGKRADGTAISIVKQQSLTKSKTGSGGLNATQFYLKPINGTAIKNGTGSLTVQARYLDGTNDVLASGVEKIYVNGTVLAGSEYSRVFNAANINGSQVVELKSGTTVLDTITLIDVTDGIDAVIGSISSSNGLSFSRDTNGTWTPALAATTITAQFYKAGVQIGSNIDVIVTRTGSTLTSNAGSIANVTSLGEGTTTLTLSYTETTSGLTVSENVFTVQDGSVGTTGSRGSKHFYQDVTPLFNLSALDFATQADLAIINAGETKVNRDVVTLTNSTQGYAETKFWNTVPTTALWAPVAEVIDGNLIVNGTIGANEIQANIIFGVNATFQGTVYVDKLVGDVTDSSNKLITVVDTDLTIPTLAAELTIATISYAPQNFDRVMKLNPLNIQQAAGNAVIIKCYNNTTTLQISSTASDHPATQTQIVLIPILANASYSIDVRVSDVLSSNTAIIVKNTILVVDLFKTTNAITIA